MVLHVWCGVCYRPASEAWLSHCGPTRVVWCVLQASKYVMVEPLCVTGQQVWPGRVIVVLHVWCGVCYRPASEAWLSHCGPTRVVCVTGQQVWRG